MRRLSLVAYWLAGAGATTAWTSAIIALSSLPLPTQLTLGSMTLVGWLWGHAVLFPRETGPAASVPARPAPPLPATAQRRAGRLVPARQAPAAPVLPPGELPVLLREPFTEAARMEAHRLAEVISAAGLFGLVNIRLQPDGMALVAPVQASAAVRMPAASLYRLAQRLAATGPAPAVQASGTWPGGGLEAAVAAHADPGATPGARPTGPPPLPPPDAAGWTLIAAAAAASTGTA